MSMIQLQNLVKSYPMGKRELTVLKGVNLNIGEGELVAIMGASGSGKTTLLNITGCLDRPTSGSYLFEGKEVSRLNGSELARIRGQRVGFIFQTFNLLSRLTALANVELGMTYAGGVNRQQAREALAKVGLADRVNHRPLELSGGEQQRVAVARALMMKPQVILADEPTGNLDSRTGEEVHNLLVQINRDQGITIVVVTHNPALAVRMNRRVLLVDGKLHEHS